MNITVNESLKLIEKNDVKFIRLTFCDIFGTIKNIAIMETELPRAFANGISFDASAVKGFMNVEDTDLLLFPDPSTFALLPWRPSASSVARFFCDIRHPDGTPFEGDGRHLLKKTIARAKTMGFDCHIGSECEFYLFTLDEEGIPTKIPYDSAGYLDIAPLDKGENVRREICLTLEAMGITPKSSHHESGPGQNEIDFKYSDALSAADNLTTFKTVVKSIATKNNLFASFMPKPLSDLSGCGLHINISLAKDGVNIFKNQAEEQSPEAESFIAGILNRICEMTAFLNPITNSYARFGDCEAPNYVSWSNQNRSQLIRIPPNKGEYARMELRSPDSASNHYIAFALLIQAGLDGIEKKLTLCSPSNFNIISAPSGVLDKIDTLPQTLKEAIILAKNSDFIGEVLPQSVSLHYLTAKEKEWHAFKYAPDKEFYEDDAYFNHL